MSLPQERIAFQKERGETDLTPQPLCMHQPIPRCLHIKQKRGEGEGQCQEPWRTPAAQPPPHGTSITWSPVHTCQSGPPIHMTYSLPMFYVWSTQQLAAMLLTPSTVLPPSLFQPSKMDTITNIYKQVKPAQGQPSFFPTHHN